MGTPVVVVTSWVSQRSVRERGEGACGTGTSMGCSPRLGLSSALHEGSGATWRGKQTQAETKCLRSRPDGRTACSRPGPRASQAQGGSVDRELSRERPIYSTGLTQVDTPAVHPTDASREFPSPLQQCDAKSRTRETVHQESRRAFARKTPQVLPPKSLSRQASRAFGCTTGLNSEPSFTSAHWPLTAP